MNLLDSHFRDLILSVLDMDEGEELTHQMERSQAKAHEFMDRLQNMKLTDHIFGCNFNIMTLKGLNKFMGAWCPDTQKKIYG